MPRNNKRNSKPGVDKRAGKKGDQIPVKGDLSTKGFKNNPNYYFKDAQQAEVMSRIQMNAFGGITKIAGSSIPTIMSFYLNPCPGVTPGKTTTTGGVTVFDPVSMNAQGINRAGQKLWYTLTCKSGRSASYTKTEVSKLILALGEVISTYEFIRRAFAIAYTYNQRNRALPTNVWYAMGVDPDDYRTNAATYLKRMNSLMAIMNSLPIPGNIAYFAKCQEIYQKVYMDYPSEMAQLFIMNPSTTWVLEENDGFVGGSYLKTVDMCVNHEDMYNMGIGSKAGVAATEDRWVTNNDLDVMIRPLQYYINVFETQINALMFSSAFSQVYSDILRAFDDGRLSRWSFDYIKEDYYVVPEFSDTMLWTIHNATVASGMNTPTWTDFATAFDPTQPYQTNFYKGTPRNDVVEWAEADILVYDPCLFVKYAGQGYPTTEHYHAPSIVMDFPNEAPSVEERVDYTRYKIAYKFGDFGYDLGAAHAPSVVDRTVIANGFELPDHWIEESLVWKNVYEVPDIFSDRTYIPVNVTAYSGGVNYYNDYLRPRWTGHGVGVSLSSANATKFHHFPTYYGDYTIAAGQGDAKDCVGELNAWAEMENQWYTDINRMIYVDIFDPS